MAASGVEKSDLQKNRFYKALNVPYPAGLIIAAQSLPVVYWLVFDQSHRS